MDVSDSGEAVDRLVEALKEAGMDQVEVAQMMISAIHDAYECDQMVIMVGYREDIMGGISSEGGTRH